MRRLILLVATMYPREWRERYGAEFEALLSDSGADIRTAFNVFCGAFTMQLQRGRKIGFVALPAMSALVSAWWWIGQRPYNTPGSGQVFRMDSNAGGLIGFFGFLILLPATVVGLRSLLLCVLPPSPPDDGKGRSDAARVGKVCSWIVMPYMAALMLASLLTPRTIVNRGDGYCWDNWCLGVEQVNATSYGGNVLYTAKVRVFSDANHVPTTREKGFLYAIDERGRRFPVFQNSPAFPLDVTVRPGESVKTSLSFLAPASARGLYLAGNQVAMPWVYLYFGSDINPLHRRTVLRIL